MSADRIEVLLVDGVGRPKIITIPASLVPPTVIPFPHPQRADGEAQVQVQFVRQRDELDPDGRAVYRQRCSPVPPIRFDYLKKSPIAPAPKLRIEGE